MLSLIAISTLLALATALPQPSTPAPSIPELTSDAVANVPRAAPPSPPPSLTPAQIEAIDPTTHACAPYYPQCRNSTVAAPLIAASFVSYGITHPSVQAALVSLMLYESASFKYYTPVDGTPGKGTFNMQSSKYNTQYAAARGMSVAELLSGTKDAECFGSAAWFVTSQCGLEVREQMWGGGLSGWENYITSCVGTTSSGDRQALYTKALGVLGSA